MNREIATVIRCSISVVALMAWFSISNHCALGGLIAAKSQPAIGVMHCHGNQPSPPKKTDDEETPCCKLLRGIVTSDAKIVQAGSKNSLLIQDWSAADTIAADEPCPHGVALELDTGPPFAVSFAESVLQRSVLVHAPPVSP